MSIEQLKEFLVPERWAELSDPANRWQISWFCDLLIETRLPEQITVGGRTYQVFDLTRMGDQPPLDGPAMVEYANEVGACLGEEDVSHLFRHWHEQERPRSFHGRTIFCSGWIWGGFLYKIIPIDLEGRLDLKNYFTKKGDVLHKAVLLRRLPDAE